MAEFSLLSLLLVTSAVATEYDGVHKFVLERAAFGSCNKQNREQPLWSRIAAARPQVFLWLGDAVYPTRAGPPGVHGLQAAYQQQMLTPEYTQFVAGTLTGAAGADQRHRKKGRGEATPHAPVIVEGVFDDHE